MKRGIITKWVKGIVLAYLFSGICLLILAFLMYRFEFSDGVVRGGILAAYVISCFLCGLIVSRAYPARKFLFGLLAGLLYFVILWAVSMIGNRQIFVGFPGILSTMLLCVSGGMLGGMAQSAGK